MREMTRAFSRLDGVFASIGREDHQAHFADDGSASADTSGLGRRPHLG